MLYGFLMFCPSSKRAIKKIVLPKKKYQIEY